MGYFILSQPVYRGGEILPSFRLLAGRYPHLTQDQEVRRRGKMRHQRQDKSVLSLNRKQKAK